MGVPLILLFIGLLALCECVLSPLPSSTSELIWEGGSITFPSLTVRNFLTSNDKYIPKNMIATKGIYKYDTLLLLMPRFRRGNPCSIVFYDTKLRLREPSFHPFPDILAHEEGNCSAIQNAVDFFLDHMGVLWILDTGIIHDLENPTVLCPPKIVCISIVTKKIIKIIDLSSLVTNNYNLQSIAVEYDEKLKAFVYIADANSGTILVHDVQQADTFGIQLPKEALSSEHPDDSLYMKLVSKSSLHSKLYITFLNSPKLYSIHTGHIRKGKFEGKLTEVGTKIAPMMILNAINSIIYYRYKNQPEVYAWDTTQPFEPDVLQPVFRSHDEFLPTDVFLDSRRNLKVLQSNFKDYILNEYCAIQEIVDLKSNDHLTFLI